MWITLNNLHGKVARATTEETIWIDEYLAYNDKSTLWSKGEVEKVQLYNAMTGTFPAGMVGMVARAAKKQGFDVQFIDKRTRAHAPIVGQARDDALYWLRDYQREAVDTLIERTRGIIHAPTGAGKTEMAAAIIRATGGKWLLIVHNKKLMHQAAKRYALRNRQWLAGSLPYDATEEEIVAGLEETGAEPLPVGLVGDGKFTLGDELTCATFQTLSRALKLKYNRKTKQHEPTNPVKYAKVKALLDSVDGVIVDECHVLPAESFWRVLMAIENAYYRIGVSGTPLARGDKRSILAVAALGPVQYRIHPDVLIDAGVLARPRIRMIPCYQELPDPPCPRCKGSGDCGLGPHTCGPCKGSGVTKPKWQTVQKKLITESRDRNAAIVRKVLTDAKTPCLIFVEHVAHGELMQTLLRTSGRTAEFVYGKHSTQQRDEAIARNVEGDVEFLIASKIFQEGVDIPPIRSVVLASGGKSVIAAIQKVGRGMRVDTDKSEFDVFDVRDKGHPWTERHTKQRVKAYQAESYDVVDEPDDVQQSLAMGT